MQNEGSNPTVFVYSKLSGSGSRVGQNHSLRQSNMSQGWDLHRSQIKRISSNAADSSLDSNNEKKQAKARDVKGYNQRSPHNDNKYYTVMFLELIWVE